MTTIAAVIGGLLLMHVIVLMRVPTLHHTTASTLMAMERTDPAMSGGQTLDRSLGLEELCLGAAITGAASSLLLMGEPGTMGWLLTGATDGFAPAWSSEGGGALCHPPDPLSLGVMRR